jgi:hypothetical protein
VAWLRREKEVVEDATRGLQQELDAERASAETADRSSIAAVTCSPSGSMALPSARWRLRRTWRREKKVGGGGVVHDLGEIGFAGGRRGWGKVGRTGRAHARFAGTESPWFLVHERPGQWLISSFT